MKERTTLHIKGDLHITDTPYCSGQYLAAALGEKNSQMAYHGNKVDDEAWMEWAEVMCYDNTNIEVEGHVYLH